MLSIRSSTSGSGQELRRTSSFDRNWEENVAESVANELVLQVHSCTVSSSVEQQLEDSSKQKLKETKPVKSGRSSHEEKKAGKSQEEKKSRPRKMMEFHNIRISQVSWLIYAVTLYIFRNWFALICLHHCTSGGASSYL